MKVVRKIIFVIFSLLIMQMHASSVDLQSEALSLINSMQASINFDAACKDHIALSRYEFSSDLDYLQDKNNNLQQMISLSHDGSNDRQVLLAKSLQEISDNLVIFGNDQKKLMTKEGRIEFLENLITANRLLFKNTVDRYVTKFGKFYAVPGAFYGITYKISSNLDAKIAITPDVYDLFVAVLEKAVNQFEGNSFLKFARKLGFGADDVEITLDLEQDGFRNEVPVKLADLVGYVKSVPLSLTAYTVTDFAKHAAIVAGLAGAGYLAYKYNVPDAIDSSVVGLLGGEISEDENTVHDDYNKFVARDAYVQSGPSENSVVGDVGSNQSKHPGSSGGKDPVDGYSGGGEDDLVDQEQGDFSSAGFNTDASAEKGDTFGSSHTLEDAYNKSVAHDASVQSGPSGNSVVGDVDSNQLADVENSYNDHEYFFDERYFDEHSHDKALEKYANLSFEEKAGLLGHAAAEVVGFGPLVHLAQNGIDISVRSEKTPDEQERDDHYELSRVGEYSPLSDDEGARQVGLAVATPLVAFPIARGSNVASKVAYDAAAVSPLGKGVRAAYDNIAEKGPVGAAVHGARNTAHGVLDFVDGASKRVNDMIPASVHVTTKSAVDNLNGKAAQIVPGYDKLYEASQASKATYIPDYFSTGSGATKIEAAKDLERQIVRYKNVELPYPKDELRVLGNLKASVRSDGAGGYTVRDGQVVHGGVDGGAIESRRAITDADVKQIDYSYNRYKGLVEGIEKKISDMSSELPLLKLDAEKSLDAAIAAEAAARPVRDKAFFALEVGAGLGTAGLIGSLNDSDMSTE